MEVHTNNHGRNQEPINLPDHSGLDFGINVSCMFAHEAERNVFFERDGTCVVLLLWRRRLRLLFRYHRSRKRRKAAVRHRDDDVVDVKIENLAHDPNIIHRPKHRARRGPSASTSAHVDIRLFPHPNCHWSMLEKDAVEMSRLHVWTGRQPEPSPRRA
jgi:hypothetical protein